MPRLRKSMLALVLSGASIGSCASALAYTLPGNSQEAAIARAAKAAWNTEGIRPCPAGLGGPTVFQMNWAHIASIYPQWAYASVKDDGCTYTMGYILKRPNITSNHWRVVGRQLDNPQNCSTFHAPKSILYEFEIFGVRGNEGAPSPCARPVGKPWCGQFANYAVNTSCAVDTRVNKLYLQECVPAGSGPNQTLPPCEHTLRGFKCVPGENAYALVNCIDGRRRIGFRLAE
jgi:hypothetical protein